MQVSGGTLTAEPSIDFSDVNGLKNSMVDHSKTLLAEMDRTKIQLCNIIAVYKIIKEDEQMAMINSVIDEKMEALKKFQRKQRDIIDALEGDKSEGQFSMLNFKMNKIEREISKMLGRDHLQSLLVRLEIELEDAQKRKDEILKTVQDRGRLSRSSSSIL